MFVFMPTSDGFHLPTITDNRFYVSQSIRLGNCCVAHVPSIYSPLHCKLAIAFIGAGIGVLHLPSVVENIPTPLVSICGEEASQKFTYFV